MTVTIERCRQLRLNATYAEKRLWFILRKQQLGGFKFRRQHPLGPYILDFFCPQKRLAIEVDGDSHFLLDGPRKDALRTTYLRQAGIQVIRFTNADVLRHPELIKQVLWKILMDPHPNPLPEGEGNSKVSTVQNTKGETFQDIPSNPLLEGEGNSKASTVQNTKGETFQDIPSNPLLEGEGNSKVSTVQNTKGETFQDIPSPFGRGLG